MSGGEAGQYRGGDQVGQDTQVTSAGCCRYKLQPPGGRLGNGCIYSKLSFIITGITADCEVLTCEY